MVPTDRPGGDRSSTYVGRPLLLVEDEPILFLSSYTEPDSVERAESIASYKGISVQKRAERRTAELLEEKQILLREAYHRIKNDMTIIASDSGSGYPERTLAKQHGGALELSNAPGARAVVRLSVRG